MEQRKQGRGWNGHFLGFWARLNCENMPVIPAWLVRRCLDDPRKIPYLLIWKDTRDGDIMEAVRLAREKPFDCVELNQADKHEYVELKRTNGSTTILQIVWQTLPRNGATRCSCAAPIAERRAVTSTVGNGIVGRDGRTESEVSLGDAALAPGYATLPKAAICAQVVSGGLGNSVSCFALSETCHGPSRGFLTCSARLKQRRKLAFANCHPSVGTGSGETP